MTSPIHHVTLSVTDADASAAWYQSLLGAADVVEREGAGWRRIRMAWPSGLVIGVTQFDAADPARRFTHLAVGLDHLGLACASEAEVRAWAAKLDGLGFVHGPVEDAPYGWAVTARDPDDIAIEFYCAK